MSCRGTCAAGLSLKICHRGWWLCGGGEGALVALGVVELDVADGFAVADGGLPQLRQDRVRPVIAPARRGAGRSARSPPAECAPEMPSAAGTATASCPPPRPCPVPVKRPPVHAVHPAPPGHVGDPHPSRQGRVHKPHRRRPSRHGTGHSGSQAAHACDTLACHIYGDMNCVTSPQTQHPACPVQWTSQRKERHRDIVRESCAAIVLLTPLMHRPCGVARLRHLAIEGARSHSHASARCSVRR